MTVQRRDRAKYARGVSYVAISHGAYDAQIFTNDREKLGAALGHDVSHSSAHVREMKPEQKQEQAVTPRGGRSRRSRSRASIGPLVKRLEIRIPTKHTGFPAS